VDPTRIAIWAFSGGGWLIGQWLAEWRVSSHLLANS
jgi:hypothetical protein